ncbi:MAG: hypothetical protein ONB25_06485 [candidate division KSB1 bacterium]|nr:hypothetical protein [candidate division KSB1 bacterium]
MPVQPSPRWNMALLALDKVVEMLNRATFVIRLEEAHKYRGRTYHYWGTGFFFYSQGEEVLALTADHNVRPCPTKNHFVGYYKGGRIKLEWVREWSSERADIAAMRLTDCKADFDIETLPVAYLDPELPVRARRQFWAGRQVAIYGYPVRGEVDNLDAGKKLEGWLVDGEIDTAQPLIDSIEGETTVQRFNIHGSRIEGLGGISGAPVLERESGMVIGVEGSYVPCQDRADQAYVRGSEIAQLLEEHHELKRYFRPFFPPVEKPKKGVAVFARRNDEPLPSLVPIAVRFCASDKPDGLVTVKDGGLEEVARAAVQWVGEYSRRLKGKLREVFEQNHWGSHKPYGCALFQVPEGPYQSLLPIHAGMVLSYLAKAVRDTLVSDLQVPFEFPESLFVCGAGFGPGVSGLVGVEGMPEALQRSTFPEGTTVLYARSQQEELAQQVTYPKGVRLIPADHPVDVIDSLWAEFLKEARSSATEGHLSRMFKEQLERLLTEERELRYAKAAALSKEARIAEREREILLREEERGFLQSKIADVERALRERQEIPPLSRVLEEYTQWLEKKLGEVEHNTEEEETPPIEITVVDPRAVHDAQVCRRLYRRLACLCHPDKNPPEAMWFTQLVEHREDRLWLEALEGALEPFGSASPERQMADSVCALVDRLFALQDTRAHLEKRIEEVRQDAASYGQAWQAHMDEEINLRETMLRMRKYDIDQAWRRLNLLLGKEPFAERFN